MAVAIRPYFIIHNGKEHMVEASQPAAAVQHVVGQSITELRPARANEVLAWTRAGKPIEVAGKKAAAPVDPIAAATMPEISPVDSQAKALVFFEDWAGYVRGEPNTAEACDTMAVFARMHPNGALDLMTFDVLRQRAPEFGFAMIAAEMGVPRTDDAEYVEAIEKVSEVGLAQLRSRLEEQPMPFLKVVEAIVNHAGHGDLDPDDVVEEQRDNGGVLASGQE